MAFAPDPKKAVEPQRHGDTEKDMRGPSWEKSWFGLCVLCDLCGCDPENQPTMSASLIRPIRSFRRERRGNCVSVRTGGEQPHAERAVRNEGQPHRMSPESANTAAPSHSADGEGCQDWAKANPVKNGRGLNDTWSSHHCGGVSGGGMFGRVVGTRDEISSGGRRRPTAGTSGEPARPVWPREKSERFIVATKARNWAGVKGPHLVDVNSEAQASAMAPSREIATTTKVRALQRQQCRTAKRTVSTARAVNGHGKPCAGKPPARFDEGRGVPRGTDNYGRFNSHRGTPCLLYLDPD
mgnify:CR=1 FL=1